MGKTRPAEIINETGFDKNMVGKYLSVLTDLKIIRREVPVTEWGFEKSKKGMYLLEDHFFRFWFHYVYPNRSFIEEGQIDGAKGIFCPFQPLRLHGKPGKTRRRTRRPVAMEIIGSCPP